MISIDEQAELIHRASLLQAEDYEMSFVCLFVWMYIYVYMYICMYVCKRVACRQNGSDVNDFVELLP